jgi:hypothetical protein
MSPVNKHIVNNCYLIVYNEPIIGRVIGIILEMKKLKILNLTLIAFLLIPVVAAAPLPDDWFIDIAIEKVNQFEDLQPYDPNYVGQVTTGWHEHLELEAPWHKHVTLESYFDWNGYVSWSGRVYLETEDIYTVEYEFKKPYKPLDISVNYIGKVESQVWDGTKWVKPPRIVISETGNYRIYNGSYDVTRFYKRGSCVYYPPEWHITVEYLG